MSSASSLLTMYLYPIFAILKHENENANENDKNDTKKVWQKIDDSKKDIFVKKLEKNLSNLNMLEEPDVILQQLTIATKSTLDECFPPKTLSNNAKKRAEQPWNDKGILKEEREQSKLFRKFVSTKNTQDHKTIINFGKKL